MTKWSLDLSGGREGVYSRNSRRQQLLLSQQSIKSKPNETKNGEETKENLKNQTPFFPLSLSI